MAKPRFRRVNIDGRSLYKTETRLCGVAILPGTFVYIDSATNKFAKVTAVRGRMYVMGAAEHQGLDIMTAVPLNDSGVGNYLEEGREFAVRMAASTAVVKDQPITVSSAGYAVVGVEGSANIIGYSQETVTLPAGSDDFVRIRARAFPDTTA